MRIAVITVVHDPRDARILRRQIGALVAANHHVTYAAPFSAYGTIAPSHVTGVDLPRASGRDRIKALRAAREFARAAAPTHEALIIHDPELLMAVSGIHGPAIIWDVHEDTASAIQMKSWISGPLKGIAASLVTNAEARAERNLHLVLAEDGYLPRFSKVHPVVPNTTPVDDRVSPPGDTRVIYVGSITRERGVVDIVATARLLMSDGFDTHVVGSADTFSRTLLEQAQADGALTWHGFIPNESAMSLLDGALCGLSLLHDQPNYRHSRPSKVLEYMAHGIPVGSTPLPAAAELIQSAEAGIVVPFDDPESAAEAVRYLREHADERERMGRAGHEWALSNANWTADGERFVKLIESWATSN